LKSVNRAGAASSALLLAAFVLGLAPARADDFGPRGDVLAVRFAASRLLAHTVRALDIAPGRLLIRDAVVVKDAAVASWSAGKRDGVLGLIRYDGRWWAALDYAHGAAGWADDAWFPLETHCALTSTAVPDAAQLASDGMPAALARAAAQHAAIFHQSKPAARPRLMEDRSCGNSDVPLTPAGVGLWQMPVLTSGYDIVIVFSKNDAAAGTTVQPLYARAPTAAEIIPYPATYQFLSTSVAYFDLTLKGPSPVTFAAGATVDVWVPFVLDDTLKYDLTIGFADAPLGPFYAKPVDNVLHYTLPPFTVTPGRTLMAEIDGNWP